MPELKQLPKLPSSNEIDDVQSTDDHLLLYFEQRRGHGNGSEFYIFAIPCALFNMMSKHLNSLKYEFCFICMCGSEAYITVYFSCIPKGRVHMPFSLREMIERVKHSKVKLYKGMDIELKVSFCCNI